jgi:hypothetical protein
MTHLQKLGPAMVLVVLLQVSQPAAAQAWWVVDSIEIIQAWREGRLTEELIWLGLSKVGDAVLEEALTPDPLTPYEFDVEGNTYTLSPEEAEKMEEGRSYPLTPCLSDFVSGFVSRHVTIVGPCVSGAPAPNPAYSITRNGSSFTVERLSP